MPDVRIGVGITAIVPTFDEEENIAECLAGLAFADEILVVDSGSTDRTREIAAATPHPNLRVLVHEYLGNGPQCNWAMDQAREPWVFIVDADERVPPALAAEIRSRLAEQAPSDLFFVRRRNVFLGRPIRHSGWGTDRLVRLIRRGSARYPERRVHSDIETDGRDERSPVPTLATPLEHVTAKTLPAYLEKLHRYAAWGAEDLYRSGRRAGLPTIVFRSVWRFIRTFVVQAGFLDGRHGLLVCALQSYGTFLKWSFLWERRRLEEDGASYAARPRGSQRGDEMTRRGESEAD